MKQEMSQPLLRLTSLDGDPVLIARNHLVAVFAPTSASEILTTPGVVYRVRESVDEIDKLWGSAP